jgi:hypothetical protein
VEAEEERLTPKQAALRLVGLAAKVLEDGQGTIPSAVGKIDPKLFDEVALILLKSFGQSFTGYLNDKRVESACRMVLWNEPFAKFAYFVVNLMSHPVS